MKKYYFAAILFLVGTAFTANTANAQQDPDIKYNKAKKEYREAQAAKAAQQTIHKQSPAVAPVQQQEQATETQKVEALKAKATKHSELKASPSQKVAVKEQGKTN